MPVNIIIKQFKNTELPIIILDVGLHRDISERIVQYVTWQNSNMSWKYDNVNVITIMFKYQIMIEVKYIILKDLTTSQL